MHRPVHRKNNTHTHTHTHTHEHSVVHCGLGVGLTAGECCAERIGEQGNDLGLEPTGDGVAAKTVVRSASKISNGSRQEISEEAPLSFHQGKWPEVSRATSQPHSSFMSVLLNCSAVYSSCAPTSPMLL
jgi:hypothetical protein